MSSLNHSPTFSADATRLAGNASQTQIRIGETRLSGEGDRSILAIQLGGQEPAGPTERYKIGDRIGGRYEVLAIHRGSMGVVYGTFDHETQLPRALKTLQERIALRGKLRDLFLEEAAVWVKLGKHPFIVRAYLVEKYDGRPYVITEYIRGEAGMGGDLAAWLGHPRLTLKVAVEMALQIAQGMQHAIRTIPGFVHRDLKPANILVDSQARAMVTDFGLVCATEVEAGTPAYMAPELWNGESPDVRTDIYAFGCILYEMFTAHRMFTANSMDQWRWSHLAQDPIAPSTVQPGIPEDVVALVSKCLAKTRNGRPQGWDEVVNTLASIFHLETGQPAALDFTVYELTAGELVSASCSLWQLGKYEEMLSVCNRALEIDTNITAAWHNKSLALSKLGRHKERVSCYEYLLKTKPHDADLWAGKGGALSRSGFIGCGEEAILCFDEALKLDSQHINAWSEKGQTLFFLGRRKEGLVCYDRALELDPDCVELLQSKSNLLGCLDRHEERLAVQQRISEIRSTKFESASLSAPKSAAEWCALAEMAFTAERDEEGLTCIDRALEIEPNNDSALMSKVYALGRSDREGESLVYCERALENDPHDVHRLETKGGILLHLKRYEEAIACYDHVLEINPYCTKFICVWACKGHAFYALKRYEEAISCFDTAYDACEQADDLAHRHKFLSKGKGGVRGIRPVGFEYEAWFTKGMAFYHLGFYDAAIACFERSLLVKDHSDDEKSHKVTALQMRDRAKAAAGRQTKADRQ